MGLLEMGSLDQGEPIMTTITDKILHHEDVYDSPFEDFVAYHFRKNGFGIPKAESLSVWSSRMTDPESVVFPAVLTARVDDGRWIVDCPNCNSALCISSLRQMFICAECGSPDMDGRYRLVVYPEDREEIERLLLLRPAGMGRGFSEGGMPTGGPRFHSAEDVNYVRGDTIYRLIPGQTIEELRAENQELGCDV